MGSVTPPFLRWAGSKRRIAHLIAQLAPPDYRCYFEPFLGSACVFFQLAPRRAVLSDVNSELIETYETVARHPKRVGNTLSKLDQSADAYYAYRARVPRKGASIQRAARFIYLNHYAFNSIYRVNRQGAFNVPRGSRRGPPPSTQQLGQCSIRLADAKLVRADFEESLRAAREGDFAYLDPPYRTTQRAAYGEYGYESQFAECDEARLASCLEALTARGVATLLSYSRRMIPLLPHGWKFTSISSHTSIAGNKQHRSTAQHILAASPQTIAHAPRTSVSGWQTRREYS